AMILLVLVYFLDGAHHRWIRLGPFGIQPSELAKPALAIFLAFFVTCRSPGRGVCLGVTPTAVFVVAGLDWRYFAIVGICGLVGVTFFVISKPYRVARIIGYLDPEYKVISRIDSKGRLKGYLK